jgi:hypothetical protein
VGTSFSTITLSLHTSPTHNSWFHRPPKTGWGNWWRSGWGTALTNRKVGGSIPYGIIGIFHWHNPSGRTTALGLTHPLT